MRIYRFIPIVVVLIMLGAATMSPIQRKLTGAESGTVSAHKATEEVVIAQQDVKQEDGVSSIAAAETTAQSETHLYLDAEEVERRAVEEQNSDNVSTTPIAVPVSFKHVPVHCRAA